MNIDKAMKNHQKFVLVRQNMKLSGKHFTTACRKGSSTDRGSSQQGGIELREQKAPPDPGLFSQCEQHTEQPGRTVGASHQDLYIIHIYHTIPNTSN